MNKLPKIGTTEGGWSRTGWLQLEIQQGYISPFWYGLAWWHPMKMVAVCYPIPINWVMWGLREIYFILRHAPSYTHHRLWKAGFDSGYKLGLSLGKLYNEVVNKDE